MKRSDVDRHVFRQAAGHGEADVRVALLGPAVVQTQLIQALQAARAPTAADVHLDTHAIAGPHFVDPLAELHDLAGELVAGDMRKPRARELPGKDLLIRTAHGAGFDAHERLSAPGRWRRNLAYRKPPRRLHHYCSHARRTCLPLSLCWLIRS